MRRGQVHARVTIWLACGLAGIVALITAAVLFAADLRITNFDVAETRNPILEFSDDLDSYYILFRGDQITNIALAIDMDLGVGSTNILTDPDSVGNEETAFYRIQEVPLDQPLDSDVDGIDDVYELLQTSILNPLDSNDALIDPDQDSRNNLKEFQDGTDPAVTEELRITAFSFLTNNFAQVDHIANEFSYYILLKGLTQTNITSPVDAKLGVGPTGLLIDPTPVSSLTLAFYRVQEIALGDPLDFDADGIDDVYELLRPLFLNPLDPSDASADFDNDEKSNLQEYQDGTDPTVPEIVIPTSPTITASITATNEDIIEISGIAEPNVTLIVEGGASTITNVAAIDSLFSITVPLQENRLNRLFITAVNMQGQSSSPQTVEVIQDAQPPSLFIDFPSDSSEITTDEVIVAGRVGDMLSGFMGLDVMVEGEAANVIVGIGQNGTFERTNVPLALGENTIHVTASDIHGNSTTKSITITRTIPSGAQMVAVSGDIQTTNVHRRLPDPIVIKVTKADGTPFPNKLVTFGVIRSDGRLIGNPASTNSGDMKLQVATDSEGLARAYWTLGADAGCGNNRISVTSKDIVGTTFFCASALPAPASQINVGSGNNQRAEVNAKAPEPLRVWVNDSCNGVEGVPVTFTVVEGGGVVNGTNSLIVDTTITGHAQVDFTLGDSPGNHIVEATYPGNPGAAATFVVVGLERDPDELTSFRGIILDNASRPIAGARCDFTVGGVMLPTVFSDIGGQFVFEDIPAGPGSLHIDGLTADLLNGVAIPVGRFPALTYQVVVVPNAENSLPSPILLPALNPDNARVYDGTQDVELTCGGIDGLKMFVKAGSMRRADGSFPSPQDPAIITLNQVHHDDVPMPMPDGAAPPFAWTLQPAGATFNPPVKIEYPNMSGLPAGAIAYFLSFNHDTERFEIVASGHVTDDASTIVTDRGVGIDVAGWGCNCPPYTVTGECKKTTEIAVALFEGGPNFMNLIPSLGLDTMGLDSLSELLRSFDFGISTKVFGSENTAQAHINKANTWLQTSFSDEPSSPHVVLVGHSWGGDSVRESFQLGLTPEIAFTIDPIDRDNSLAFVFNQRHLERFGPENTYNFLAPVDNVFCPGIATCLRGYIIKNAKNRGSEVINLTDHFSVVFAASPCIACEFTKFAAATYLDAGELIPPGILAAEIKYCSGCALLGLLPRLEENDNFFDETWVLQVGSQSVQVGDDGLFRIRNISAPDLFGEAGPGSAPDFRSDDFLRLTGVRVRDGISKYAYSDRFQIRSGNIFSIDRVTFSDTPPPVPVSLSATPSTPTLTEIGQTAQMTVMSTMADGTEEDVTARADGTTYRTSNTSIASVNGDGLVTARSEGSVFITAVNEGATAVIRIQVSLGDPLTTVSGIVQRDDGTPVAGADVRILGAAGTGVTGVNGKFSILGVATDMDVLGVAAQLIEMESLLGVSGQVIPVPAGITDAGIIVVRPSCDTSNIDCVDTDGDCIPDPVEISLGLNPIDPDTNGNGIPDGSEDSDGDGLSNCAEAAIGTNANAADTDEDGLTDSEEVGLLTDPVSDDTDGDHIIDGDEFFYGTDPFQIDTDRDGWSDEAEINGNGDPLDGAVGIQSTMTATPAVTVVLPQLGSGEVNQLLAAGSFVAMPPVTVIAPDIGVDGTDSSSLLVNGSFVASPPVTVVAPNIGVLSDGIVNLITNGSFVASPPVTMVAPNVGVGDMSLSNLITNGAFVATPPVTLIAPNVGVNEMSPSNLVANGAFIAQPPIRLSVPNVGATTNELTGLLVPGSFSAQPPVQVEIMN